MIKIFSERYYELKNTLEKMLILLNQSNDSVYAHQTVSEVKDFITESIKAINRNKEIDKEKLLYLLLPTGSLQEISIENGWGEEFLKLASKVETLV
ncbi:hypothetical protein [Breznakiella homolactica]|uniref:Uncharacterized protein n=1 Tax=Breznakiella homolactica TaxID=2798577 RepID=A0A7T7XJL0_9SPIR|nr:hypothetical protein [Breznakiella homolactica]QQO07619.1 hypothetical protein JFL75_11745 [Breznakiella homolactica]